MIVIPVELLDGTQGHDFVAYRPDGFERFSARLVDGDTTLDVGWTENVPRTALWLREVQRLAGGVGSFTRIRGTVSDELEAAIHAATFRTDKAAELLCRSLGGEWRLSVAQRIVSSGPLEIVAELIGDGE